ncbi:rab11 family-interacting protein 5 isoform X2 [Clupea harengus]|uniref:Rab11 family-interacting protein 5 isoform X2 n=1 Tax=Clupea harengus TaxID=7950 RepID=A0A6P3VVM7_CLUHA|nr:rab11 family-interacting protein 5 isoform X2 [Clupea harengus]
MSSAITDDEQQRWVPTHVQVTVLRARGLRAKGKHGTNDAYVIIQVGKEKYSTCVTEKTTSPEWGEECTFELQTGVLESGGRDVCAPGSCDLTLTAMHRALIGLDVFLGQAVIPLDKAFQDRISMRKEWHCLHSKTGKKEKERGEVQVTVQFTRHNLTASMYDLSMKDKPHSAFGKLKERIRGKMNLGDEDSASAIIPGGYGALSRMRGRLPSDGGGEEFYEDDEGGEARRSKMRNFFLRGKLRKSSDTRSTTSLGSESSESSSRGGSLSPTAGISVVVSDLSNSPSNSSNLTADNSPEHTLALSPLVSPHKHIYDDDVCEISILVPQSFTYESPVPETISPAPPSTTVANGHAVKHAQSPHNLKQEPQPSGDSTKPKALSLAPGPALGSMQKTSPMSLSLQNLSVSHHVEEPHPGPGDGRRWSLDKAGEEERAAIAAAIENAGKLEEEERRAAQFKKEATPVVTTGNGEVKKQKWGIFSHGRSESAGKATTLSKGDAASAPSEGKHKGWFGSKDSQAKPSPHPVKPLTPPGEERKPESRSVLEKLKSSIHPGRSQDTDKKNLVEGGGSYYHLNHSELVSLLLQREGDLQRERAEFEHRGVLLEKRETEIRKTKLVIRDLEDYIDRLLVRILDEKPTLLQVRTKLK